MSSVIQMFLHLLVSTCSNRTKDRHTIECPFHRAGVCCHVENYEPGGRCERPLGRNVKSVTTVKYTDYCGYCDDPGVVIAISTDGFRDGLYLPNCTLAMQCI